MPGRQLAALLAADGSLQINPAAGDGYTLPPAIGTPGQGLIVPPSGRVCDWGDISAGRIGKILMVTGQAPTAGSFTKVLFTGSATNLLQKSVLSTSSSDLTISAAGVAVLLMAQIIVPNYPTGHSIQLRIKTIESATPFVLARDKQYNDSGSNRDLVLRCVIGHVATEANEVVSVEVNMSSSVAISNGSGDAYFSVRE